MNKLNKRSKNIPSFILYAVALFLSIYAVCAFIHCIGVISEAKSSGELSAAGNEYDIVNYYMSNCFQYVVNALLLAASGLILHKKDGTVRTQTPSDNPVPVFVTDEDEELDEWFEENNEFTENFEQDD